MRRFQGDGGRVYAAGEPFAFTGVPLEDCGDGFVWRCADETVRCWVETLPLTFTTLERGRWMPLVATEVDHAAGAVTFNRCVSGQNVHATGTALTTALVAEGPWVLEQNVLEADTLGERGFALATAVATLETTSERDELVAAVRRVMAVLPSAAVGAFVGVGELARGASGLKVTFERGVTYVTG